jgi:hypothetical protein
MSTLAPVIEPVAPAAETPPARPVWLPPVKRTGDNLVIGWLHGTLHAAVFHRQKMLVSWSAAAPVHTLEEFEPAIDEALTALMFAGTEVSLLLENEPFVHQTEQAPGNSDALAASYLKARVARHEKEHGRVLWTSQQTVSIKQDRSYILHLLPGVFYDALQRMMSRRRLVLAQILPLIAPLQRELNRFPISKGRPVLVAVEAGGATIILVAQVGGQVLITRTILASWTADPGRIGLEINRSLLYANQQFGLSVERIWLLGQTNHSTAQVSAKCGAGKQITVLPTAPVEWMQAVVKLPAVHPANLVTGYLLRKRRSLYVRTLLMAACWLGLGLLAMDLWNGTQAWEAAHRRFADLTAREASLAVERDQLIARNRTVERQRELIRQLDTERLPSVPGRFLALLAGSLPAEMRLIEYSIKWNGTAEGWAFRLEGSVETDEETAREIVGNWQRQLSKNPLRVRFSEVARAVISAPSAPGASGPELQRFNLEGTLFESSLP